MKYDMYLNAFQKAAEAYRENQNAEHFVKKLIVYGVKAINAKPESKNMTYNETINDFLFVSTILGLIETLTPNEFMNLFPIDKEYKGHKWGIKDYFYTRDYINSLNPNEPIKDALTFIWEYTNQEIARFNVFVMNCISNLRKLQGKPSLMEEWADMNGVKTYTMHKDQKGREFLFDNESGKTIRIKKKLPKHMKLIKGGLR